MNKTLRWVIALIVALLINYALFAAFGKLIGTSHYDNLLNHRPAISISFIPLYKDDYKQTHGTPTHPPLPEQPTENHTYKEQVYDTAPINKKRETEVPLESKPMAITKHTPESRNNYTPVARRPVFSVEPVYPMFAITRGIEGWVTIEFTITENGEVSDPEVTASAPSDIFDQTVLTAISRWRYSTGNKSKSSAYIKFELRDK